MDASENRLEACRKAGRALSIAKQSGDPSFHSEMVHAQVSARAELILKQHPDKTFSPAQREAICELLASALLMNVLASQPQRRWLGKALDDFKEQRPFQQVASVMAIVSLLTIGSGLVSAGWAYGPGFLHWIGTTIASATEPEASEGRAVAKEQSN